MIQKLPGSYTNPICVLDEEERKELFQIKLESSRNSTLLKNAILTHQSQQITFALIQTKFKGTLQTKQNELLKEIITFYYDKLGIDISRDYFCTKKDIQINQNEANVIRYQLIVYGVDFLNTKQIGNLFSIPNQTKQKSIKSIQWIDDSSCKLTYYNQKTALEIINRLKKTIKIKSQQKENQFNCQWIQLKPYYIHKIQRKLFARFAVISDQSTIKSQLNQYGLFQQAKQDIQIYFLQKYKLKDQYEHIKQKIDFHKSKIQTHKKYKKIQFQPNNTYQFSNKFKNIQSQNHKQLEIPLKEKQINKDIQPINNQQKQMKILKNIQNQVNKLNEQMKQQKNLKENKQIQQKNQQMNSEISNKQQIILQKHSQNNIISNKNQIITDSKENKKNQINLIQIVDQNKQKKITNDNNLNKAKSKIQISKQILNIQIKSKPKDIEINNVNDKIIEQQTTKNQKTRADKKQNITKEIVEKKQNKVQETVDKKSSKKDDVADKKPKYSSRIIEFEPKDHMYEPDSY